MRRSMLLCLVVSITLAVGARNQNRLTIRDGLAGESVYKLFKDRYGLVWIGTSNGLNAYNGRSLMRFNLDESRDKNTIIDIAQTTDGTLYAATHQQVAYIDEMGKIRPLPPEIGLKAPVNAMAAQGDRLYIGAANGLTITVGDKKIRQVWLSGDHLSKANVVNDLCVDPDKPHLVWLLTNTELYCYDTKRNKMESMLITQQTPPGEHFRVLAVTGEYVFIGGYNNGLQIYQRQQRKLTAFGSVEGKVITELSVSQGSLYVATDGDGVYQISLKDLHTDHHFTVANGELQDNSVYCMLHDDLGLNWFGYYRKGLCHEYHEEPLFHYYRWGDSFDTRHMNVRSLFVDGDQKMIGTRQGLCFVDESRNIVKYFPPDEMLGAIITSIAKYNGEYYIGTFDRGACRLNPQTLTLSRFGDNSQLRISSLGRLKVSPRGELWIAGTAGIFVYNANSDHVTTYNAVNSHLYDAYVNSLMFDRLGRCWIGTHDGTCIYTPSDGIIRADGFPEGFFNRLSEPNYVKGRDDQIFCYSAAGIYQTTEDMSRFGAAEGTEAIRNNLINLMLYDGKRRHYWIGTERGLFRYDEGFGHFRRFGEEYGVMPCDFSTNACFLDANDRLWIGTSEGMLYADLKAIEKHPVSRARILMDLLHIGNEPAADLAESQMVRQREIHLKFDWRTEVLAFRPAILNYSNQKETFFEYRLGDEGQWQAIRGDEMVELKGIPLGHTPLYLRQAGGEEATRYEVSVTPSVWFVLQLLAMAVFLSSLYFYWKYRRRLKRQTAELEHVREELALEKEKYKRVKTDKEESERLFTRLKAYVEKEKPYLNADLKMSDVASALECSTVKMSQLLNIYAEQNYYDFINRYRLEEFKRRLDDPKYANYTLVALSEMCGFKKSSFFSTFKKMEGCTPSEYVEKRKTS